MIMNNSKKATIVRLVSFIVEPLKVLLFTIFISFFGFNYTGKEDTPIYLIVMMASFAISLLFYVLMPAPKKLRRENLLYCFLVLKLYSNPHVAPPPFICQQPRSPVAVCFFIIAGYVSHIVNPDGTAF